MPPRFSPSWSSNMSINIRGNLLVVAGTFLFKVITIEKKYKVVFVLHYVSLHFAMDGLDGCILKLVSRTGRRYQFWSYFWRGGEGRMHWCTIFWWMFQSPGSLCALGQHLEGNWWLEQNLEDLGGNVMKDLSHWSLKWQLRLSAASQLSHFMLTMDNMHVQCRF